MIAGLAAVTVYTTAGGAWTLRLAAVFYVLGAIAAWNVRKVLPASEAARRTDIVELLRVDFTGATWDMMALRAAVGFAMFHFAFSLRAGNEPAWLLGAVIAANSIGGFLGAVVAPSIRSRINEHRMFTWSMLGSAGAMVAAGLVYTRATLIGAVLILGLAASVGRRALDSTIQQFAPRARRGRVYASLETRLELAWVAAGCVAVASRLRTLVGVLALAGFLVVMAAEHVRRHRLVELLEPPTAVPLAERLITRAETLAGLDHHDEAIIVALSAVEVAEVPAHDPELQRMRELVHGPATHDQLREAAERVIARARALIQNPN
jgi:MFS family permease